MNEDYPIPATGTIAYQYFEVPTNFAEDRWVQAFEVRPGNRAVVHHVSVYVRPPGSSWMKDAKPGEGKDDGTVGGSIPLGGLCSDGTASPAICPPAS